MQVFTLIATAYWLPFRHWPAFATIFWPPFAALVPAALCFEAMTSVLHLEGHLPETTLLIVLSLIILICQTVLTVSGLVRWAQYLICESAPREARLELSSTEWNFFKRWWAQAIVWLVIFLAIYVFASFAPLVVGTAYFLLTTYLGIDSAFPEWALYEVTLKPNWPWAVLVSSIFYFVWPLWCLSLAPLALDEEKSFKALTSSRIDRFWRNMLPIVLLATHLPGLISEDVTEYFNSRFGLPEHLIVAGNFSTGYFLTALTEYSINQLFAIITFTALVTFYAGHFPRPVITDQAASAP